MPQPTGLLGCSPTAAKKVTRKAKPAATRLEIRRHDCSALDVKSFGNLPHCYGSTSSTRNQKAAATDIHRKLSVALRSAQYYLEERER